MLVIPAIDIMDGHCVRLVQGDFEKRTVYSDDPATIAVDFARAGAERLHVVDLDAARGAPDNRAVVHDIIDASGMSVQVAGGVRTEAQVESWLEAGATNVVMGTAAVRDPELLAKLAEKFPRGIIAALDIRDGQPVVSGWTETEARDIPTLVGGPLAGEGPDAPPAAVRGRHLDAARHPPRARARGVGCDPWSVPL